MPQAGMVTGRWPFGAMGILPMQGDDAATDARSPARAKGATSYQPGATPQELAPRKPQG